ncbi:alpha/beta hydrolase [Cellulomonas fimi]|uniref:alpha/beta hydrolase n=1 Tax=Cellulomonas sp. RIT-PI-Y TaxID=3035297 RepID=UPI0021D848B9
MLAFEAERAAWPEVGLPLPEARQEEVVVPVAGHPDVRVRIVRPDDAGALPAVVQFFGGGFRQGGLDHPSTDWTNRSRARDARVAVVAVDYALAPEHRCPTPVEQGHAVLQWVREHGPEHGIDVQRLAVGGQSSGANIAASLALLDRDRSHDGPPLRLQVLEVPVLDLTTRRMRFGALRRIGVPAWAVRREYLGIGRDYLARASQALDPIASPLRHPDLSGLPPAHLLLAQYDVLRGDGEAYHARLRAAGVESSAFVGLGLGHDSPGWPGTLLAARDWHGHVVSVLRGLHV